MEQTECSETSAYKIRTMKMEQTECSETSAYKIRTMKMGQTECSETSAYKIQMPGNYPEESIQESEHGESLKSRISQCDEWEMLPMSEGRGVLHECRFLLGTYNIREYILKIL